MPVRMRDDKQEALNAPALKRRLAEARAAA
jgi:hypothetical protein